jgi:hypothetical protein
VVWICGSMDKHGRELDGTEMGEELGVCVGIKRGSGPGICDGCV